MRPLTHSEIAALQNQHCTAENWQNVTVSDNFLPENIHNVVFRGKIVLENNVFIRQSAIINYHIKSGARIENVYRLETRGKTAFGNGVKVAVLNEAGGREVKIFDKLSAHWAYILAMYRHRPQLIEKINSLIDKYVVEQSSEMGIVGENAELTNCGEIVNVKIGNFARLKNVAELENGSIGEQTFVGTSVIAQNFIFAKNSKIFDNALIDKCFIGEVCEVGKQFSATDCLIFCNSCLLHGEAAAVFAGAFTTSHHKSTLLIGSMFSFYNAGSGTNQSNHLYKLGPVHQGIFERGVKTSSGSYLMLEARVGAFSLVLGHHESHFDNTDLPFSYILEKDGKSELIPAVNFQTVGTQRDSQKWRKRDHRTGETQEHIIFDLLNPYTVGKICNGIVILEKLQEKNADIHSYKGLKIKNIFLKKGIDIYRQALIIYIGEYLQRNTGTQLIAPLQNADNNNNQWLDISGLIIPQSVLNEILLEIEKGKNAKIEDINYLFSAFYENYSYYEENFVKSLWQRFFSEKSCEEMLVIYTENHQKLRAMIAADAEKEFSASAKIGFGIDGDEETQQADFEAVRGRYENNEFVKNYLPPTNSR